MSLIELLYLDEDKTDSVIAAVRQWCAEYGCELSDIDGKKAMAVAVRLAKSTDNEGFNLLPALFREMTATAQPVAVPSILVVEDEPLIAIDIEQTLQMEGLTVHACPSLTNAMTWLAFKTPSTAILDFQLKDGNCTNVATLLQMRGVPIIFCSGTHRSDVPATLPEGLWLQKPFDDKQLTKTIRQTLKTAGLSAEHEEGNMTQSETQKRRSRGLSPRGDFEQAKTFATASEDARVAADKRKTDILKAARLRRQFEEQSKTAQPTSLCDQSSGVTG